MKDKSSKQPKRIKYVFFDENFSEFLATGLNEFEKVHGEIEVVSTFHAPRRGAQDQEVANHIASVDGVLITRDKDFKKKHELRQIVFANKMGVITYKSTTANQWDIVLHFVKMWPKIRKHVLKSSRPFYFNMNTGKELQAVPMPSSR